jgi:hypothetical protein
MRRSRTSHNNKYGFSEYLTRVGDFVQTEPLSKREAYNIYIASHMWAWEHMCRVSVRSYPSGDNRIVRITLISKDRERFFK